MKRSKTREDVTLLDVLVDGFEKNEILDGYHLRTLPLADEASAVRKFDAFAEEARRWKGAPLREVAEPGPRLAAWADLEIWQAGRGLLVRARAPWFESWWNEAATWNGDPLGPIYEWVERDGAWGVGDERPLGSVLASTGRAIHLSAMTSPSDARDERRRQGTRSNYVSVHVERALQREGLRQLRRISLRAAAERAAHALRTHYGERVAVYVFGSVLDAGRFRLDSDIDLAVRELPRDRYYEAWALAEAASGSSIRIDLVRLEDAPDWLAEEVRSQGKRLA
jgi:predicted nucleotidyltransferase